MLTNMKEEIKKAKQNKTAIPQFNINNLEWTRYILEACEENKYPVILGVSEGAIEYIGGYNTVVGIIKNLIKDLNITIPVSIHLDHGTLESCKKAIEAGFTSVMLDLSKEPLAENIKQTKKLIELAHPNILVETEIGPIGTKKCEKIYTRLEDCVKMSKSGEDLLAIAIGNKHGLYDGPVQLDFELLKEINEKTNIPLVLHGASGINNNDVKKCVELGITKINFNTELQIAWADAVKDYIEKNKNVYDPRKIIKSGENAIKNKVKEKLEILDKSHNN